MNEKRGAQLFLLVGGIVAGIVGGIMWAVSNGQAEHDENVNSLTDTMMGGTGDTDYASPARVWMWVGIALLILGVVMVLAYVAVRAAAGSGREVPVDRPTLTQVRRTRDAGTTQPTASVATDLRALADMHEKGLLSDAEFEAAKQRALGSV